MHNFDERLIKERNNKIYEKIIKIVGIREEKEI